MKDFNKSFFIKFEDKINHPSGTDFFIKLFMAISSLIKKTFSHG